MDGGRFSIEGEMQIGPQEQFFVFMDGEWLGKVLLEHLDLPMERGYTGVGRVRLSIERLEIP